MADAGKKKLTKAEKEKLKKEEEERRLQEEEEERIKMAEEEKRKKREEKLIAAEKNKLENEERRVRRLEMSALTELLERNRATLQARDDQRRKDAKWARYMRCDGSPDPTVQSEINTYINLKMECKDRNDAESVLKDTQLDLALIDELNFLLLDTPLDDLTDKERLLYRQTIGELQHVIQHKLGLATLQVLCDASKLQDPETNNLQYCLQNNQISLCVWGNLSKNPRIRAFEFAAVGFGFDIPKVLTLSNCCVRYLHTQFDHYSQYSKAYYPRHKKKEEEDVPAVPQQPPEATTEEKKVEEGQGEEKKDEQEAIDEDALEMLAALNAKSAEQQPEEQQPEEEVEVIEEDFEDPKTPEPLEWEDFDEEDDVVDLRAYQVLGGVFSFDLLDLPPQPKVCKNLIVTQLVVPPKISYLEYTVDAPAPVAVPSEEKTKDNPKKDAKDDKEKRDEKPPINITINLPKDVLFLEEPVMAHWDSSTNYWRTDGFSNTAFDEENRVFKCSVSCFGPMCMLQDTHINMPFQSWEIRPHTTNSCVITIIAAITELEIQIKDGLCCLSQPSDKNELKHILNHWVTPKELISNMQAAGVNIFPQEDSSKYVTVQNKNPITLQRMYEQIGLVASCMAFSWSKWNSEVDANTIIVQGCEALKDEPMLEEEWQIFMFNKRRCMRLKMNEFDENFSDEMAEDMIFRSNFYHYALANFSEAAKERIQESSTEFTDCVQQLLKATQVLVYA